MNMPPEGSERAAIENELAKAKRLGCLCDPIIDVQLGLVGVLAPDGAFDVLPALTVSLHHHPACTIGRMN